MLDCFPSITAADLNRAAALLGLYHEPRATYARDVKAQLVEAIRRQVRAMQAEALDQGDPGGAVATAVPPALVAFADIAGRDREE